MVFENTPLISRSILFGNPDHTCVRISPNKAYISYVAPLNGVLNIWIAKLEDLSNPKCITKDTNRGIQGYSWGQDNCHILYAQDKDGDENWHIYSVHIETLFVKDLTPYENVHASIAHITPQKPSSFLALINKRRQDFHDLYEIEISSGKTHLVYENNKYVDLITNDDFSIHFGVAPTADGGAEMYQFKPSNEKGTYTIEKFLQIPEPDFLTTSPLGLSKDSKSLYMMYSLQRNTAALVSVDIETRAVHVLAEDEEADFCDALIHPTDKRIQAFASNYERKKWQVIDTEINADFEYLQEIAIGEIEIISRSLDDEIWIVCYLRDVGAPHYYIYNRAQKTSQFLFSGRASLDKLPLARMMPMIIQSRDGLNLVSYLTLPAGVQTLDEKIPHAPLPMVLLVHGGPWARNSWGYDSMHQWLSNRGYAVLSVNFRGSTGFGKDFINASYGQWSKRMHDDLVDAVNWAVSQKIAHKEKIAIMGGSYGGYATLVGLTLTPEIFACGIDIVGPSSLITLLKSIPEYWKPVYDSLVKRIGADPETPEGLSFLTECSPLTYVDKIVRPLLIGQGANDPRVKITESDQIVAAMSRKGLPVEYLVFQDEGHGFVRPENRMAFFAAVEIFLAQYLGGRQQDIERDFENTSLKVMHGNLLSEALTRKASYVG